MFFSKFITDFFFILPELFLFLNGLSFILFFIEAKRKRISNNIIISLIKDLTIYLIILYLFLHFNCCYYTTATKDTFLVWHYTALLQFLKIFFGFVFLWNVIFQGKYLISKNILIPEIFILLIFLLMDFSLIISTQDLMLVYLLLEIQSIIYYILISLNLSRLSALGISLLYFILNSISSVFIIFGISYLYGFFCVVNIDCLSMLLEASLMFKDHIFIEGPIGIFFSFFFIVLGISMKIGIFPFHFWVPPVYEYTFSSITSFFSTISYLPYIFFLLFLFDNMLLAFQFYFDFLFLVFSFFSFCVGSFLALQQKEIKKFMAYNSIINVGILFFWLFLYLNCIYNYYLKVEILVSFIIYVLGYTLININFWSIFLTINKKKKYLEYTTDFILLYRSHKFMAYLLIVTFFALAGVPPFLGFFTKFLLFISALKTGKYIFTLVFIFINIIVAFFFIKLIKVVMFDSSISKDKFMIVLRPMSKIEAFFIAMSSHFIIFYFFYADYVYTMLVKFILFNVDVFYPEDIVDTFEVMIQLNMIKPLYIKVDINDFIVTVPSNILDEIEDLFKKT
jgi:NADH-quinone oxidoreductase subunit N